MAGTSEGAVIPEDPTGWMVPLVDGQWWPVRKSDDLVQLGPFAAKQAACAAAEAYDRGLE